MSIHINVSVTQCQIHCIMLKQWGNKWILHTYIHKVGYARMNVNGSRTSFVITSVHSSIHRGELSYLAPLGSEKLSAPYFKQCFFWGGGITPPD